MPKIARMPGTRLSPEVLLRNMLEDIDQVKSIALVIEWEDDTFQVCNSAMPHTKCVAMGAFMARKMMDGFLSGEVE